MIKISLNIRESSLISVRHQKLKKNFRIKTKKIKAHIKVNSMNIKFSKYQGLGNDFILIDNRDKKEPIVTQEKAKEICNRNFGIGADGVIFAMPPIENTDFSMRIYNNDGGEPEMCGNGIRCLAKYIHDLDNPNEKIKNNFKFKFKINTLAGIIQPELLGDGRVHVDMGRPILEADKIPTTLPSDKETKRVIQEKINILNTEFTVTAVSMGNPHACVYSMNNKGIKLKDFKNELKKYGPIFEKNELFPSRVNTEFIEVYNKNHVGMCVWERGAGPTLACGTGACALVVAGCLEGRIERRCRVDLPGGPLDIEWDEKTDHVFMTGPAECVFSGHIKI